MAFGVIACNAIKVIIARLVGSAIAWKISRLISLIPFAQLFGCKYMRNYSVSQNILQNIFLREEMWGELNPIAIGSQGAAVQLPLTVYVLAMVGHLKNVSPTFAQMPNRSTNVEFTIVCPIIANTKLAVRCSFFVIYIFQNVAWLAV